MKYLKKNSALWKEVVKMSEMTIQNKRFSGRKGLDAFLYDLKKYRFLGILLPIILTIPSLVVQILWICYDRIMIGKGYPVSSLGRMMYSNAMSVEFTGRERSIVRILQHIVDGAAVHYAVMMISTLAIVALVAHLLYDLYQSFYGSQSSLALSVPCKKPVLFLSKFLAVAVVTCISIWLLILKMDLFSGVIGWENGGLVRLGEREFAGLDSFTHIFIGIDMDQMLFYIFFILMIWAGAALILSLSTNLQKTCRKWILISVSAVVGAGIVFLAWKTNLLVYEWDLLTARYLALLLILVIDFILMMRHNTING